MDYKNITKYGLTWVTCLLFVMIASSGLAQKGTVKTSVSKDLVAVGEKFKFIISIENLKGDVSPPNLAKFRVAGGPMTQRGSSNVNGKVTSYVNFTYFLVPLEEGTLSIGPAIVNTGSEQIKSNSVKIKVVAGQDEVVNSGKKANIRKGEDQNLFVRIYIDKTKVYKGEQITATYVLYNRYRSIRLGQYDLSKLQGFWKEDVKIGDPKFADQLEKVNGLDYRKAVLARQVLIPQKTGKLSVGPLKMDAIGQLNIFNSREVSITSNTPSVEVLPLPSAPETFSGAVGSYDFTANVDNRNVATNDALNFKVTVKGKGNLQLISEPKIDFDQDFEVYDPKIIDNIRTSGGGMNGSRTFEYLIIPRYAGEYDIDPLTFTYFDPSKEKYITITTDEIKIKVEGDPEDLAQKSERRKKEVELLENEIRYINSEGDFRKRHKFFAGSGTHIALFSIPLLFLGGLWFWKKRTDELSQDVKGIRIRKAGKKALKEINLAKKALSENKKQTFYESVFGAMYNYLSEKLDIPYADLTKNSIESTLINKGVESDTINDLMDVLQNCEMARFAPRAITDDEIMLQKADELIHKFEGQLT